MITANVLKIIAIITMVLDHVGFYFWESINSNVAYILRTIGRISMPIFLYLLVQGFFYTKNIKKYIFKLFVLAIVSQLALWGLGILDESLFLNYSININECFVILFSYVLSLIMISMIEYKTIIKKLSYKANLKLRMIIMFIILVIYSCVYIDYGIRIPFIGLGMYFIETLFKDKKTGELFSNRKENIKKHKKLLESIYIFLIGVVLIASLGFSIHPGCKYAILFSLIPIALYNGKKGKKNKAIQNGFYIFFPIQHIVLYLAAMLMSAI